MASTTTSNILKKALPTLCLAMCFALNSKAEKYDNTLPIDPFANRPLAAPPVAEVKKSSAQLTSNSFGFDQGSFGGLPANNTLSATESSADQIIENTDEPAPVIVHALDQVNRSKNLSGLFGAFDNSSEKNCEECSRKIADMRYGQCNSSNNYLEGQLDQLGSGSTILSKLMRSPIRMNSIIKPTCMKASVDMGSISYKTCSGTGYGQKVSAPCHSESYFKLVNNGFDAVSSCMKDYISPGESDEMKKLDVRAIYALINIESGFQVNAVSGTGAGGIGQFTGSAIEDVNENHIPAVRDLLSNSSSQLCNGIASDLLQSSTPIKSQVRASCDRISITNGNPVKNMLYTFASLKGVKDELDDQIFKNSRFLSKFNLSPFDLARVKRAMMVWSHNTGVYGTLTPAKVLLNRVYQNKKVVNAEKFIQELQQYLQKYPATANRSRARRIETSRYFPNITDRLNLIENNAGGGSCVN